MEHNAVKALSNFDMDGAIEAADDMARAFEQVGDRIASALESAARAGEFSFSQMAETVARDLARLAVQEIVTEPLGDLINSISSSVFSANTNSQKSNMNVTLNVSGVTDVRGFQKSETQIAAALSRAMTTAQKFT